MSDATGSKSMAALERLGGGELNQLVTAFFSRQNITFLLDEIPFAVWIKDVNGRFAGANSQWLAENNFNSPQDIMGYDAYQIHEPVQAAANVRHDWEVIEAGAPLKTSEQRERDGRIEVVHTTRLPLRNSTKEIIGIMGFNSSTTLAETPRHQQVTNVASIASITSDTDPLTGAGSREALDDKLCELIKSNQPSSLLVVSLDDFSVINDSLGYAFGDMLLRGATKRLTTVFGSHLYRHRGDEFAVVLPTVDVDQLHGITRSIREKWRQPMFINDTEIFGSISIGLAELTPGDSSDVVLQNAELAVHEAKRSGGDTAVIFTPEHRRAADEELSQQMLVRRAVANREFHLHWQPLFDATTGAVLGCEALLRWRPAGGSLTLPAADFFPFLERSGLIDQVGRFVIDAACKQHASWRAMERINVPIPIFVNVSSRQLESDTLADDILATLQDNAVSPHQLTIEIDDVRPGSANTTMIETLKQLRTAGVKVAIDNFGKGNASLASLMDLPIDVAKIDRSLVGRVRTGQAEPVLDALQAIVQSQALVPVVQGVETEEQLTWLRERGWDCVQGYHLAQPMDVDEVTELIAERLVSRSQAS